MRARRRTRQLPFRRTVIFVDGDFWHGHGWQQRGFSSCEAQFAAHRDPVKWRAKIARNMERDREVEQMLKGMGWRVLRVLESAIRSDVTAAADQVVSLLVSDHRVPPS